MKKSFHPELYKAINYSLAAGGKRFRPVLCISAFQAGSKSNVNKDIMYLASSLELIHTYSLIHDDLPSMDNDDLRRGKPSCHKQFSESTAILAGDAMNSLAFFLISRIKDKSAIPDLLALLHTGAGGPGMVSGQMEDIENENKPAVTGKILHSIHNKKTGALIQASMLMGNRLRKDFKKREKNITEYSRKLGLLFQITDDILDIEGSAQDIGKTPGKDSAKGKITFPSVYGLGKSRLMIEKLVKDMIQIATKLEPANEIFLKTMPEYIAKRKN